MSKSKRWAMPSGYHVLTHAVVLLATFGPAIFSGWKWWGATTGGDRIAAIGFVAFVEISLALMLPILIGCMRLRPRPWGRIVLLPFFILGCAAASGAMLWQPATSWLENRFERTVVPDTTAAQVELATVKRLERNLEAAAREGGVVLQAAISAAGGDIGEHGFDGAARGDTADGHSQAATLLVERRVAARTTIDQAEKAKASARLWDAFVAMGIALVLVAVIFGRWLLLGPARMKTAEQEPAAQEPRIPWTALDFAEGRVPPRPGRVRIGCAPSDKRPKGHVRFASGVEVESEYHARVARMRHVLGLDRPQLRVVK